MKFDDLIEAGEQLKNVSFESPQYKMWKNDVREAVKPYGEHQMEVLESCFHFGRVIMGRTDGDQMKFEAISKTIEFLQALQKRQPEASRAQAATISQKTEEARHTLRAKFGGNTTINATNLTFGDNSPIGQVQVGEFIAALIEESEKKLPEGEEKGRVMDHLKSVLANPTFAAVSGATLPEVLKRLMGS